MIIIDRGRINNQKILLLSSIGGSPITIGHTRVIQDCKKKVLEYSKEQGQNLSYNDLQLLIIVNSNEFLMRKHNFVFQDENERAEIIDGIKTVDFVYIHHSNTQDISDCIHYFQPHYFCKGGDRSKIQNLPYQEIQAMQDYGVVFVGGVGGTEKVSSSSDLMKKCAKHYLFEKPVKDWLNNDDVVRLTQGEFPIL
jgi:glycerol-3-phosphate cytidylyltransferase-like family protein